MPVSTWDQCCLSVHTDMQQALAGICWRFLAKCVALLADIKGSMLCYEALARLHEFNLNIDQARATFQEASKRCRGPAGFRVLSRLLCEFASFEKRQNNLKVSKSATQTLQMRV